MNKQNIIDAIGAEAYANECAALRGEAAGLWERDAQAVLASYSANTDTPHIINDLIWSASNGLSMNEQIQLMLQIYEDMPCTTLLMFTDQRYRTFSDELKTFFWQEVRRLLSTGDPALSAPLEYMLAIDFFELSDDCQGYWVELVQPQANEHLLRSVLRAAATAPWGLKAELYARLLHDPSWHEEIYRSISGSYYSLYGRIDKVSASFFLSQLTLPRDTSRWHALVEALGQGERHTNACNVCLPAERAKQH